VIGVMEAECGSVGGRVGLEWSLEHRLDDEP